MYCWDRIGGCGTLALCWGNMDTGLVDGSGWRVGSLAA